MRVSYYRNLNDLPLYNWRMYNETGDKGFLVKSGMLPDLKSNMDLAWYNLNDEYLEKFCESFERNQNIKKRKKMLLNLLTYVSTGSMVAKMEAEIIQIDLVRNAKALSELNISFLEEVTYVKKYYCFQVNENNT